MKMSNNKKFVLYQIIIWSIIIGIQIIPQIVSPKANDLGYEKWQLVLDYTVNIFFLVSISFGLKYVFNKKINLNDFRLWEILKIFFLFIVAALTYYFTLGLYNYLMLNYVYLRPEVLDHPSQKTPNQIAFVIVVCFLFFLWTVFYTIIKSTKQLRENLVEKARLEASLKESQLNALKGQINPHFMFNSLNNIRGLILENPEKSREMITRLSEMLRYSLTKNNINAISLEEELEVVDNFIAISKIQFEERLQFEKQIEAATLKLQIPPMVIQLLVENAVKHGIANLKQGGIVKLKTNIVHNNLMIEVSNSGKLTIDENSTQLGLQNIKERISLLYGNLASFSLEENENEVRAIIKLPMN